MRLTFLGTGTSTGTPVIGCRCTVCTSADPRDRRLRCSSLVEADDPDAPDGVRRILIDCGPDFREQMLGIAFKSLDAILITHEHYDHVGGLDDLRPFGVFGDMTVYADSLCSEHLRQRIPYCFTPREKRYPGVPSIDLETIQPHQTVHVGGVEVLPLRVMHGALPILGFRIGPLAYITDMSSMPAGEEDCLRGIRLLVVNALRRQPHPSHQTIDEAIAFARRIGSQPTYLIHTSHHILPHALEEQRLPQGIHLAYDGLSIKV